MISKMWFPTLGRRMTCKNMRPTVNPNIVSVEPPLPCPWVFGAYTQKIFLSGFFFWWLRLLNNSPQRMFRTNQWPPRCTDMEYGWDITAVPLAKEHLYGRIVLLHKNSAWKIDEGECQNVSETDTWNECLKGHQKVKGIQRLSHVYEPIL